MKLKSSFNLMLTENNPITLRTTIIDILCYILIVFGILGNLLGIFIFSLTRFARRKSTIYVRLAICNSIANVFCIFRYASILHSKSRFILYDLTGHFWLACKIYEFSFAFRIISSWIALFWMLERLIYSSTKLQTFFLRWNLTKFKFIVPMSLLILILSLVIGPPVIMFKPYTLVYLNVTQNLCGINSNVSIKWQKYFSQVHFGRNHHTIRCFSSELIPTFLVILFNISTIYQLIQNYKHFHPISLCKSCTKYSWSHVRLNLCIVLVLHSLLLFSSFLCHIIGYLISTELCQMWWISLAIFINCSLNFYVYCLSDRTFRKETRRFIKQLISYLQKRRCCQKLNHHFYIHEIHYFSNMTHFIIRQH